MHRIRITANDHKRGWTAITTKSGHEPNGIKIAIIHCITSVYGACTARGTSYHWERTMAHPAPFNAEPIRLTATRSP